MIPHEIFPYNLGHGKLGLILNSPFPVFAVHMDPAKYMDPECGVSSQRSHEIPYKSRWLCLITHNVVPPSDVNVGL